MSRTALLLLLWSADGAAALTSAPGCAVATLAAAPGCAAAALGGSLAMRRQRCEPVVLQERRFEVCQGKYCSKKGSKKTLALFQELADGLPGVTVEKADMSHTEHGCFDECTMGPNVRVDGAGPQTDGGRILNGVRGAAAVAELLGVELPPPAAVEGA